jgi:hypothetical protein
MTRSHDAFNNEVIHMPNTPDFNRRQFVGVAAATVAAGPLGLLDLSRRVNAMTQTLTDVAQPKGSAGTEIRPFSFKASDADLADLRRRVNATKWPEREVAPDSLDGVPLRTMQNLARYWGTAYPATAPARAQGARSVDTITTKDGVQIFYKDWGKGQPIVFSHGWPLSADDWDAQMLFFLELPLVSL